MSIEERLAAIEERQRVQGEILAALEGVGDQVSSLADHLSDTDDDDDEPPYKPLPTVRWWSLAAAGREEAEERIREFYTGILAPMYGTLGALPRCWEQHQLAWTTGDWLTELWNYLHLSPRRTVAILSAQADLTTRIIPAALDLVRRDAKNCDHQSGVTGRTFRSAS